jgi:hypothetical protein
MTRSTKKLFNAPWKSTEQDFVVDSNGHAFTQTETREQANRLARLPELYDELMYFVVNDCPHAFISNDECRLCPNKKCKTREAVELLRKVRDAE